MSKNTEIEALKLLAKMTVRCNGVMAPLRHGQQPTRRQIDNLNEIQLEAEKFLNFDQIRELLNRDE